MKDVLYDSLILCVQISRLSSLRVTMPNDTLPLEARENTLKKVSEILSRFREKGVPLLDPEDDINVCYSQRSYMLHIFSFSFFLLQQSILPFFLLLLRSKVAHTERQHVG